MRILMLLALLAGLVAPFAASAEESRSATPPIHLGVKSCSGGPCHGSAAPVGKVVLQNEHTTWLRHDAHSRAYLVLLEERSQRIARNLGFAQPAHEADLCLDCHADNVPASLRGPQFSLEDGVGCEACHGGSERWLTAHVSGAGKHARNVELGMTPLDDAETRAELCVSCHFGDENRFVTHRIMGAGHPRMSFELDTFSAVQPQHWRVDDDYRERGKQDVAPAKLWAVGQAVLVRETLSALTDPTRNRDGIWPEFVFFDCQACHHPMSITRWSPRTTTGLADTPGVARLNDSSLLMLRHILGVIDPAAGNQLDRQLRGLHAALSRGEGNVGQVAGQTHAGIQAALPKLISWDATAHDVRQIAQRLIDEGMAGEYSDYAASEQTAMAVQALAATLDTRQELDRLTLAALNAELERLLTATESDDRFMPAAVPPILKRLLPSLVQPSLQRAAALESGSSDTVHSFPASSK